MTFDAVRLLQSRIEALWSRAELGAAITVQTDPQHDGGPHVEVQGAQYNIVGTERGAEIYRHDGLSIDAAAAWYLLDLADGQARAEELQKRRDGFYLGYSRWNWMARALEILQVIDPKIAAQGRDEAQSVLVQHPLSEDEQAYSRWPLP